MLLQIQDWDAALNLLLVRFLRLIHVNGLNVNDDGLRVVGWFHVFAAVWDVHWVLEQTVLCKAQVRIVAARAGRARRNEVGVGRLF